MASSASRRLPRLSRGALAFRPRNGTGKGVPAVSPQHAPCGVGAAAQAEGPSPLRTRLSDDADAPAAAAGAWGPRCAPPRPDVESPPDARSRLPLSPAVAASIYPPPSAAPPPAASDAASQQPPLKTEEAPLPPLAHVASALGPPRTPFATRTAPSFEPGRHAAAKCRSGEEAGPWSSSLTKTPSARSLLAGPGARPWGIWRSSAECRKLEDLLSGQFRVMSPLAGPPVQPWGGSTRARQSWGGHTSGTPGWCSTTGPAGQPCPALQSSSSTACAGEQRNAEDGQGRPKVGHASPSAGGRGSELASGRPPLAPPLVHRRCITPPLARTPHAAAPPPVHRWCTSPTEIQTPPAAARSPPPGESSRLHQGSPLSLVRHRCTPRLSFVPMPSIPLRACSLPPFCPLALPLSSLANVSCQFAKSQPLAALALDHWHTQRPPVGHWRTQRPVVDNWRTQRRSMFIQTQSTPNPASLKFLPGVPVLDAGATADFASARAALTSPLALALFRIDGVARVFLGSDFITVSKAEEASWDLVKPEVFAAIMDFFASGKPVLDASATINQETGEEDSEIVEAIKELLETRIRPAVQEDGGDIDFHSFNEETGVAVLRMRGACSGCPSSSVTLKSGVENMLMHYIPEVTSVEQLMEGEEAPE